MRRSVDRGWAAALGMLATFVWACSGPESDGKIPVTTSSREAREIYRESRSMMDRLRTAEARELASRALELDASFALAHLMMASTAPTATEFFESLQRAVDRADRVSEGERLMILGLDAGTKGDPDTQRDHYVRLAMVYPEDERAHNLLGGYYFVRQEWDKAIAHYERANAIAPDFSPPYNQLGYALRFVGRLDEAEQAFRQYIRLIPDEPNPYDSYAELLMKRGKFEESLRNYEMALERDPDFLPSFIGIGNNQIFMGRTDLARETFERMSERAVNDADRRQSRFWTVVSFLHDERYDDALTEAETMYTLASENLDTRTMSNDLILMGDILLAAGSPGGALEKYHEAIALSDDSDSPDEVKRAARRNILYNEARVALARNDLEKAKTITNRYGDLVGEYNIPAERRRHHELVGLITMAEGDYAGALEHLDDADQQDPRVLYETAMACKGKGDIDRAREMSRRAAQWNGLGINFAYVKKDARALLSSL